MVQLIQSVRISTKLEQLFGAEHEHEDISKLKVERIGTRGLLCSELTAELRVLNDVIPSVLSAKDTNGLLWAPLDQAFQT